MEKKHSETFKADALMLAERESVKSASGKFRLKPRYIYDWRKRSD